MAYKDSKEHSDVTLVCSVCGTDSRPLTELAGQVWPHRFLQRTWAVDRLPCCEDRGEGEAAALFPPPSPYILSLKSWYIKARGELLVQLANHRVCLDRAENETGRVETGVGKRF